MQRSISHNTGLWFPHHQQCCVIYKRHLFNFNLCVIFAVPACFGRTCSTHPTLKFRVAGSWKPSCRSIQDFPWRTQILWISLVLAWQCCRTLLSLYRGLISLNLLYTTIEHYRHFRGTRDTSMHDFATRCLLRRNAEVKAFVESRWTTHASFKSFHRESSRVLTYLQQLPKVCQEVLNVEFQWISKIQWTCTKHIECVLMQMELLPSKSCVFGTSHILCYILNTTIEFYSISFIETPTHSLLSCANLWPLLL